MLLYGWSPAVCVILSKWHFNVSLKCPHLTESNPWTSSWQSEEVSVEGHNNNPAGSTPRQCVSLECVYNNGFKRWRCESERRHLRPVYTRNNWWRWSPYCGRTSAGSSVDGGREREHTPSSKCTFSHPIFWNMIRVLKIMMHWNPIDATSALHVQSLLNNPIKTRTIYGSNSNGYRVMCSVIY